MAYFLYLIILLPLKIELETETIDAKRKVGKRRRIKDKKCLYISLMKTKIETMFGFEIHIVYANRDAAIDSIQKYILHLP